MDQQLINLKKNIYTLNKDQKLVGLFVLRNKEKITGLTEFIHKKPNLKIKVSLKFILLDESELDLEAKVIIEKGARFIDTCLRIDTLLLSENAKARVIPSMEIKENDVNASHAATIKKLDEDQITYLMSRGLSRIYAEKVLIEAFTKSLIDEVTDSKLKAILVKSSRF